MGIRKTRQCSEISIPRVFGSIDLRSKAGFLKYTGQIGVNLETVALSLVKLSSRVDLMVKRPCVDSRQTKVI